MLLRNVGLSLNYTLLLPTRQHASLSCMSLPTANAPDTKNMFLKQLASSAILSCCVCAILGLHSKDVVL
jgi:hypothetical protein